MTRTVPKMGVSDGKFHRTLKVARSGVRGNTGCAVFAAARRLARIFVSWRPCLSGKDIREAERLRLMALDGPS